MVNKRCFASLKRGVEYWNTWRNNNLHINLDLSGANLGNKIFRGINFSGVDLTGADLKGANLVRANYRSAELKGANLSLANLSQANLTQANLVQAQAQASNFAQSILTGACLENLRINRQSSFEQVTCQYLYLKYYQRRRVPQSNQRNLTSEEFNSTIEDLLG